MSEAIDHVEPKSDDIPTVALLDKQSFDNTLRVRVGHVSTSALVDTGATISVLNSNFLAKLNPRSVKYMKPDVFKVYGVGIALPMKSQRKLS